MMASVVASGRARASVATADTAAVRTSVTAEALAIASGSPVPPSNRSTAPWCESLPTAVLPGCTHTAFSP
jgi:hypothetical protein